MSGRILSRSLSKILSLACVLLAGCGIGSTTGTRNTASAEPDRVERYGDIEVVIHTRHGREEVNESWSLRWRGQPVVIDSLGGMALDKPMRRDTFNAVFVVGDPAHPDLLVNVGDPNNASVFHLLRQENDKLAAPVLCKLFGGNNSVRVLDGNDAGKLFEGPNYQSLFGARRILLGSVCLYDADTAKAITFPAKPQDVHLPPFARVMSVSPDGRMFARVGIKAAAEPVGMSHEVDPVVLVADFDRDTWTRLPVDPQRMRYAHFEEIDPVWLDHHFQWRRGADGHDRLVERPGFKPLPWRGYFHKDAAQYDVRGIEVDSSVELGDFLVRCFQAKPLPGSGKWQEGGLKYEVEEEVVNVNGHGFFIARSNKPYWPGKPGDPERQKQLIRRIGETLDAEFASGKHGAMFVAVPEGR